MVDNDRERIRETDRSTYVQTEGGDRGRGTGLLIALILLIAVIALLFFLFRGDVEKAADEVNVDVDTPALQTPDVEVPDVQIPDEVNVNLPDVDVNTNEQ